MKKGGIMANCLNCNCLIEEGELYCKDCFEQLEAEQHSEQLIDDLLNQSIDSKVNTVEKEEYDPLKQSLSAISTLEDQVVDLGEILMSENSSVPKRRKSFLKRFFSNFKKDDKSKQEREKKDQENQQLQEKKEKEEQEQLAREKRLEKDKKKQEKKKRKVEQQKEAKLLKEKKREEKEKKKQSKLQQLNEVEEVVETFNKKSVSIVVIVVVVLGVLFLYQTKHYHYELAKNEAHMYYERQQYEQAYKKLLGIKLKDEEQQLFEQIEQIMLVYRPYRSYENYEEMNCRVEALHSLLNGYRQYKINEEKAKEKGLEEEYLAVFNLIKKAIEDKYHMTLEQVETLLLIEDSKEYTKQIVALLEKID